MKSESLLHAHAQTTKTYYKHQDSIIEKAQVLKTKTSANSDIKDNSSEIKLWGRLLASFQEDAKYEHLDALCTPESFVTHSNFDTPGGTVYYILKVSVDVLLVKGNVYDSVDDCVVAYMKYTTEAGFVVRHSCQKRLRNGDLESEEFKHLSKRERQLTYLEQAFIMKAANVNI
ncbi:hypothetical protein Tco_1382639, partial [Tanacetum coccineum]